MPFIGMEGIGPLGLCLELMERWRWFVAPALSGAGGIVVVLHDHRHTREVAMGMNAGLSSKQHRRMGIGKSMSPEVNR